MSNLAILEKMENHTVLTIDSREVAKMIGKEHKEILRDIRNYIGYFSESKIALAEFFLESTYFDAQNKKRPNYQITKKGCEFIAHKLTGQKGAIFTATYINRFHEMEKSLNLSLQGLSPQLQLLISMELEQKQIKAKTEVLEHRINNLDATNIDGTPRQRLNDIVKKYAYENGILYKQAWKDFRSNFNIAYRTNLELRRQNYMEKNDIKRLSYPEYMEKTGLIEDALRVADKMLNS